jgi:hypothetical protein
MKRGVSILLGVVLVAGAAAVLAGEQAKEQVVTSKAQRARGAGADENIKKDSLVNDPKVAPPAPPSKGGEKTRGILCGVVLDNWTPWYVAFYVDGVAWGVAAPWGEASGMAFAGGTRVYARATFVDGTYVYWGPQVFSCARDEVYRWKIGQ